MFLGALWVMRMHRVNEEEKGWRRQKRDRENLEETLRGRDITELCMTR